MDRFCSPYLCLRPPLYSISGRQWRNISALGLLAFIWAASGIMEAAIPTATLVATRRIIIVMVTDIPVIAAVMGIMAAARDITAEARRCHPSERIGP